MSQAQTARSPVDYRRWVVIGVVVLAVLAGAATYSLWSPRLKQWLTPTAAREAAPEGEDDHAGHDHTAHSDTDSLELSEQAQRSIRLKTGAVALSTFARVISVPGMVVERPGRSRVEITAPLTGIVTKIHTNAGEAVTPGEVLFEMRLTHEELVQLQADLLRTAEELDVIGREVTRLEKATENGAVAGKALLERQYEMQKQEAVLRAQRQALVLHGLSVDQVAGILKSRMLLSTLEVRVPTVDDKRMELDPGQVLQVQDLQAELGKHVTAGDVLAVLSDHGQLLIEGEAFEQDTTGVQHVLETQQNVTALLESAGGTATQINDLRVLYLANRIDASSRALHFYVGLPNRLLRDTGPDAAPRYIDWAFKPGQRMVLRLPIEQWKERLVLPVTAIAQDGVENYVFRVNGRQFERQAVQVEYRDPLQVVVANDGSLFPGDKIALTGAQQIQLAIKNKSGGGIDPHAGHNH
ncbi:MAG TPA: HlyD family efflux transporter periplasmic adaptor subunit [Pirellulaceae bacterium]|nr:HlyD family efflux transporter periplasmic adaptor subunit [Pirellulaceae bacterium]